MNKTRPTLQKRKRERAKQERRQQKEARRAAAREQRQKRAVTDPTEDPDLAGIKPGPQPLQDWQQD